MNEKTYTLEQIKQAFFSTFHQMGEFFFPYHKDELDENYGITNFYFEEFVDNLGDNKENENHN